ncbi:hypothetical protein IT575_15165 [bacterium]|nr:hypothetical protein [bacterium]
MQLSVPKETAVVEGINKEVLNPFRGEDIAGVGHYSLPVKPKSYPLLRVLAGGVHLECSADVRCFLRVVDEEPGLRMAHVSDASFTGEDSLFNLGFKATVNHFAQTVGEPLTVSKEKAEHELVSA